MIKYVLLTMHLRGDNLKRLVVPEHGKDDIADLMHHGPDSHVLFLVGTFAGVIVVNNRIDGRFRPFIKLKVI